VTYRYAATLSRGAVVGWKLARKVGRCRPQRPAIFRAPGTRPLSSARKTRDNCRKHRPWQELPYPSNLISGSRKQRR